MLLTDIIKFDKNISYNINNDIEISGVTDDSRKVKPGMVFVALTGSKKNGLSYVKKAISTGAKVVLCHKDDLNTVKNIDIPIVTSKNPRLSLSKIAARFYPAQPKIIACITGTNGKSSTVHFLTNIWQINGLKTASLGTLGASSSNSNRISDTFLTTPNPIELHKILNKYHSDRIDAVALEASSHGLDQNRIHSVKTNFAAFTNISRDHLDYHETIEDYVKCKLMLFTEILSKKGSAVLNFDDEYFSKFYKVCRDRKINIITYGNKSGSDWQYYSIKHYKNRQSFILKYMGKEYKLTVSFLGNFQIQNVVCALALSVASGLKFKKAINTLKKLKSPEGRLMKVSDNKLSYSVYVDYAHSPDALLNVLKNLKPLTKEKLLLVFGCGGERDLGKRRLMGEIAYNFADIIFVTDDNPRNEDPQKIRKEIIKGCPNAIDIEGRDKAIITALSIIKKNDILLIAGKGHEKYQEIANKKLYFSDIEFTKKLLTKYRDSV